MKYEEALADANLALQVEPFKLEAYSILSDCLIATQKFPEAVKILGILSKSDASNQTLQSQYETLLAQTSKSQKSTIVKYLDNQPGLGAKYFQKVREQSRTASTSANFSSLKTFIESERESIVADIDAAEAEELKIAPVEARKKRARMVKRNKKLLSDEA